MKIGCHIVIMSWADVQNRSLKVLVSHISSMLLPFLEKQPIKLFGLTEGIQLNVYTLRLLLLSMASYNTIIFQEKQFISYTKGQTSLILTKLITCAMSSRNFISTALDRLCTGRNEGVP